MANDGKDNRRSRNKRKNRYGSGGGGGGGGVKRGGPAILFTCETGRESKCQREGLQILDYYFQPTTTTTTTAEGEATTTTTTVDKKESKATSDDNNSKLSLEEELAMLKSNKKNRNKSEFFRVYETGCRGTIVAMCTLPNSSILPSVLVQKEPSSPKDETEEKQLRSDEDDDNDDENEKTKTSNKKSKLNEDETAALNKKVVDPIDRTLESANPPPPSETNSEQATTTNEVTTTSKNDEEQPPSSPSWDPLDMVFRIMQDIKQESSSSSSSITNNTTVSTSHVPCSRFVTRMIPLQATCYASSEEIEAAVKLMLNRPLIVDAPDKTKIKTFSIVVKRRICGNLTRDQVIDAVANVVGKECSDWKVDISNPDYRFQMELCKSLCGISILKRSYWKECQKFNLAEIRAPAS